MLRFPPRCFKVTEHIAAGRCGRICPPTSLMNLFNLHFFWPSGSSDTALGGVIKAFHDICECDLLPPPRPGVNHCGALVLSHEIPLSHGGTRLNSAWQVLRLVLGRQTAEFHQRDGERLQPKVTDNLSLFFFLNKNLIWVVSSCLTQPHLPAACWFSPSQGARRRDPGAVVSSPGLWSKTI